jgi:tetratricopeptide (TPR) repeat protein
MKKTITLFLITLTIFISVAHSQPIQKSDSIPAFEKARYLKEDLEKGLSRNSRYPSDALKSESQGDVIFSFVITKEGKMENILMVSPLNPGISPSAFNAINQLDKNWAPAKVNGNPIDKKYTIVYRYRFYVNVKPDDLKSEAEGYVKKKKYDKALKSYNEAIEDNPYDYKLFESRAQIKELLGDSDGSKLDHKASAILLSDVMAVETIISVRTTRLVKSSGNATYKGQY